MVNCTESAWIVLPHCKKEQPCYIFCVRKISQCMYVCIAAKTLYDTSYFLWIIHIVNKLFLEINRLKRHSSLSKEYFFHNFPWIKWDGFLYLNNKLGWQRCPKRSKGRWSSLSFTGQIWNRIFKTKRGTRGWDDKFSRYNPVGLHCYKKYEKNPTPKKNKNKNKIKGYRLSRPQPGCH